jgi:endonuclease-3 related protein
MIPTGLDKVIDLYRFSIWWPVYSENRVRTPAGPEAVLQTYVPRTLLGRFEIALGAVLTQNTRWAQVEKVLARLLPEIIIKR